MGKGSSPAGNTTTTVQQQNPLANAQLPYLGGLWSSADWIRQNPGSLGSASDALWNLPGYAADQGWNAAQAGWNIMPQAMQQYQNQINQGMPAQTQANMLTGNAGQAVSQALDYSQALGTAANSALGQAPYWQNQFLGAGQNALNTLQGYGANATSALGGVGNYALSALPGMGQAATSALTGLAPGALSTLGAMAGRANDITGLAPGALSNLSNLAGGASALTGMAPGALSGMSNLSGQALGAGNPAEAGLNVNAAMALANPALSSGLRGLASGAYINPSTNPAYAGMIQAATQPLVNQYETATAPQVASQFEGAGRYGSGAQTNAQGQAQYGLGQALSNAVAGITNNAYNTGLNATLGAGSALGGLYNQGIGNITSALGTSGQLAQAGVNNAGNLLNQGYGTAGNLINQGLTTGANILNQGYNTAGNLLNQGLTTGGNLINQAYGTAGNLLNQGYTTGGNLINQGITGGTNALTNAYNIGGGLTGQGITAQNAAMANAANTGLGYLNAGISGLGAGAGAAQAGYGTANTALTGGGQLLNTGDLALSNALSQAQGFATYPESQYTSAYNSAWLPLSNEAGILGGAVGGTGTTQTSQPYYSNTGANVLGGLLGGANLLNTIGGGAAGATTGALFPGLFAGLISDRRVKRNIKKIGMLRNGLPVYSFRYVGSKRMQIGLMADDVEKVHPEAVVAIGPYHIKAVDYAKAVQ